MAKRILPYRDYSEHDVVNMFSLSTAGVTDGFQSWTEAGSGKWDSGVVVKVSAGATLPGDLPSGLSEHASDEQLRKYLGASQTSAHIGYNAYPYNGMTVEPAGASDVALGITLRETLAYDENGEKLLYYKQKLDEAQAVLPGQTVPVLTKGLVLLSGSAFASAPALGDDLEVSSTAGKLETATTGTVVGSVIAIGEESDDSSAKKYLCKVSF